MTEAITLILAIIGFAASSLSMHKHHRDVLGMPPSPLRAKMFLYSGWTVLGLSVLISLREHGWSLGIVVWLGLGTVAALIVALSLTYGPRRTPSKKSRRISR
jgi:hypothetical protein